MRELLLLCRQKLPSASKLLSQAPDDNQVEYELTVDMPSASSANNNRSLSNGPSSSRTSLDSTGSSLMDAEKTSPSSSVAMAMAGSDDAAERKSCGDGNQLTNGHLMNGVIDTHMTNNINNCDNQTTGYMNHVISPTGNTVFGKEVDGKPKRPTSVHSLHGNELLLVNHKNDDSLSRMSVETNPSSYDQISIASSEDRISESGSAQESTTSSSFIKMRRNSFQSSRSLDRRQTLPSLMQRGRQVNQYKGNSAASFTSSSISSVKRYGNMSGQAGGSRTNVSSLKVKIRRNPSRPNISVKRKSGNRPTTLLLANNPTVKLLKVVLAGNDSLVSQAAKAYAHLQVDEPNLFSGLELEFYHVPLSRASPIHAQFPEMARANVTSNRTQGSGTCLDLPEPMFEQMDFSGNDVHIGRFLAHKDSWYERNLMTAVHHLLRLLPSVSDA